MPTQTASHTGCRLCSWSLISRTHTYFRRFILPNFAQRDQRVLRRYVAACEELAESTVLGHKGGVTVNLKDQNAEPYVRIDFPPKEAIRGTTVLFKF